MTPGVFAPLLDHLWQSTVFGLAAAFAALALRRYRPAVRYWLWLAASLKFLIPVAVLADVGRMIPWPSASLPQSAQHFSQAILAPASTAAPFLTTYAAPAVTHTSLWPLALAGLWLAGFAVVSLGWVCEWRAIRALVRAATPLDLGLPIRTVASESPIELGVFGIFRPVLIVPAKLLACVSGDELDAILAHEMCHMRRRDNLWAALHQAVKALFWFHPLVWWAGARMAAERELACDEYALRRGARPAEYAQCILRVCRFYAQAPACVAGISGADLKKRVLTIAGGAFGTAMGWRMRSLLAGLIALCVVLPFAAGAIGADGGALYGASLLQAGQNAAVSYAVASVKPSAPNARGSGIRNGPEGGLRCVNDTAMFLIAWAYDVQGFQISGAPPWASSDRYDVTFTAGQTEASNSPGQLDSARVASINRQRVRLQEVLRDRFGLVVHRETRSMSVYTLTVAKPILKLAAKGEGSRFGRSSADPVGQWTASAMPISILVRFLSQQLQRPVDDATGLTGLYDFTLTFDPASVNPQARQATGSSGTGLPSLFGALKDQLGLKVETKKGPVQFLVIDKLTKPAKD